MSLGLVKRGGGDVDAPAGVDHERHVPFAQPGRHRPVSLALQIDVENGEIEPAFFDLVESTLDAIAGATDLMSERIEEVLEHHSDERLILHDQYGTPTRHQPFE